MTRIAAITTKTTSKYEDVDWDALKKKEMPFIHQWKEQGLLESFYIRSDSNGAVLVFNGLDKQQVHEMMEGLPFFPYLEKVELMVLNKIF